MKGCFRDKLQILLTEFNDNSKSICQSSLSQLRQKQPKGTEESQSFYTTNSSFYKRASTQQKSNSNVNQSYQQSFNEDFNNLDSSISEYRQRHALNSRSSLVTSRTPYIQYDRELSNNKMKRKIARLNNDCFGHKEIFHYLNRPIPDLNKAIFGFADVKKSIELCTAVQGASHSKMKISDLVYGKNSSMMYYDRNAGEDSRMKYVFKSGNLIATMDNKMHPLSKKEQRKKNDKDALRLFKDFSIEGNERLFIKRYTKH